MGMIRFHHLVITMVPVTNRDGSFSFDVLGIWFPSLIVRSV